MKPRERVMLALDHEEPDRVPIDLSGMLGSGIHVIAYQRLSESLGIDCKCDFVDMVLQTVSPSEEILRKFDSDFRPVYMRPPKHWEFRESVTETGRPYFVDEWGTKWGKNPFYYDWIDHPMKQPSMKVLEDFDWPDPSSLGRTEGLREQVKILSRNTDYAIVAGVSGPISSGLFEQTWSLRGLPEFLTDMIARPEFADALLDRLLDLYIAFYDMYLETVGDQVQIVEWGDDYGMQTAPLISPTLFRRFFRDRNRRFFEFVKSRTDAKIFFHSCGSIYPFVQDLIEVGVDILSPIQPRAAKMNHAQLKREFGGQLNFHGGLDVQETLPHGTTSDVREAVKQLFRDMALGGGYIFAPAHNIQPDVPPQNIITLYEAAREYGHYPLSI